MPVSGGFPRRHGVVDEIAIAGRSKQLLGEPVRFAVEPRAVETLFEPHGFDVADFADGAEMTRRYATGGRTCDPGMYVGAARLR